MTVLCAVLSALCILIGLIGCVVPGIAGPPYGVIPGTFMGAVARELMGGIIFYRLLRAGWGCAYGCAGGDGAQTNGIRDFDFLLCQRLVLILCPIDPGVKYSGI